VVPAGDLTEAIKQLVPFVTENAAFHIECHSPIGASVTLKAVAMRMLGKLDLARMKAKARGGVE
jgi:hypothetical protein